MLKATPHLHLPGFFTLEPGSGWVIWLFGLIWLFPNEGVVRLASWRMGLGSWRMGLVARVEVFR